MFKYHVLPDTMAVVIGSCERGAGRVEQWLLPSRMLYSVEAAEQVADEMCRMSEDIDSTTFRAEQLTLHPGDAERRAVDAEVGVEALVAVRCTQRGGVGREELASRFFHLSVDNAIRHESASPGVRLCRMLVLTDSLEPVTEPARMPVVGHVYGVRRHDQQRGMLDVPDALFLDRERAAKARDLLDAQHPGTRHYVVDRQVR